LKVAYLVNGYPRTSHSFIRREIKALEALGVEVLRFSQRPLDEPLVTDIDREELARTRVVLSAGAAAHARALIVAAVRRPFSFGRALLTAVRLGWRSERGLLRHLAYLAEAAVLARWLEGTGVSHLHAHFGSTPTTVALLCAALGGPPFSFTIHGFNEYEHAPEKVARAAFVLAISSFGKAQLYHRVAPSEWPKIHEVHCGVEDELLVAAPTPVPDAPRLVCVGRLHAVKGHLVLLEAAARLIAEGIRLELLLAGDGPLRPVIADEVRRRGLDRCVRMLGWTSAEQVRDAIVASRALVLPSFTEGLPVVLMEALALGRPVIASTLSGIPELVVPGTNGWLVPAASVDGLVVAMREALEAPPVRLAAMGRAGAALVRDRHDPRREARKLLALLLGTTRGEMARLKVGSDEAGAVSRASSGRDRTAARA
jgi:glycosyltransferase involved in cell wall biosynthesis